MSKLLTTAQACDFLECSDKTLRRYVKRGNLKKHGSHKNVRYDKKELLLLAKEFHEQKDTYDPKPEVGYKTKTLNPHLQLPEPTDTKEDLLDANGKAELFRVTNILKDEGILDKTHDTLLFKYAFFQQKVIHYMQCIDDDTIEEEDRFHMTKTLDQYQKWVLHYEKELLISTASRLKVFPLSIDKTPPKEVDPFEEVNFGT